MDRQPGHDTRTVRLAMFQARAEPLTLTENLALVDASGLVYADLSIPDVDVDYLADRRPGLYRAWEQNRTTEET